MTLEITSIAERQIPIQEQDRTKVRERIEALRKRRDERILDAKTEEEIAQQRDEILELNPQNILVVCHAGVFRSGMVAEILNDRGYEANNVGTKEELPDMHERVANADAIIFMTKVREQDFKQMYGIEEFNVPVRIIGLTEDARLHEEETKHLVYKTAETKLDNLGFITKKEPL